MLRRASSDITENKVIHPVGEGQREGRWACACPFHFGASFGDSLRTHVFSSCSPHDLSWGRVLCVLIKRSCSKEVFIAKGMLLK